MTLSLPNPHGTLVLDCEGLSKAVLQDPTLINWLATARDEDAKVITSAATLVGVSRPRIKQAALQWTLSRVTVEPVTEAISRRAIRLLHAAGLHGHKHAIDAMLSATALAAPGPGPVVILTSDPVDIAALCGEHATVVKV